MNTPPFRIVLDTASFINALRSRTGAAAELVRMILAGQVTSLMDYKLSMEYRDVALRPMHLATAHLAEPDVLRLIGLLERTAEGVTVTHKPRPLSPDPDDDMILDLAINGRATTIVTLNKKDFSLPASRFGITVLSPGEFLAILRKRKE